MLHHVLEAEQDAQKFETNPRNRVPSLKLKLFGQPVDNFSVFPDRERCKLQLEALADDLAGELLDFGSASQSDHEVGRILWRQFGGPRLLQLGSECSRGLGGVDTS